MVYNTQNYWGSGLCPSFGIKKVENVVSETGPVSETSCSTFLVLDDRQSAEPQSFSVSLLLCFVRRIITRQNQFLCATTSEAVSANVCARRGHNAFRSLCRAFVAGYSLLLPDRNLRVTRPNKFCWPAGHMKPQV
jgi:hypothetical protein